MSDGMGREFAYLSSHANNRYFIPNWGRIYNIDGTVIQPWDIEKAYVMNEKISPPLSTRGLSIKPTTNGALWTYRTTAFRKPSTTKS